MDLELESAHRADIRFGLGWSVGSPANPEPMPRSFSGLLFFVWGSPDAVLVVVLKLHAVAGVSEREVDGCDNEGAES